MFDRCPDYSQDYTTIVTLFHLQPSYEIYSGFAELGCQPVSRYVADQDAQRIGDDRYGARVNAVQTDHSMLAYGGFRHVSELRPGIPEIPAGQRFQATVNACLNLLTAADGTSCRPKITTKTMSVTRIRVIE
jgi:hypothetical protein